MPHPDRNPDPEPRRAPGPNFDAPPSRTPREALREIGMVQTADQYSRLQIAAILSSVMPEDGPPSYVAAHTDCGDLVLEWNERTLRYDEFAKANHPAGADRLAHALMTTKNEE